MCTSADPSRARITRCLLRALPMLSTVLFSGCAKLHSDESAFDPAGPQAGRIHTLMWVFLIVCAVVFVAVMITLFLALTRKRPSQASVGDAPILEPEPAGERRMWTVVSSSIVLTTIILFVLLFGDFATGRAMHDLAHAQKQVKIKLIGHQWWWEVQYVDWPEELGERGAYKQFFTANEIHIPADGETAVEVQLQSADVIHSFWVPNLHGKKDLVPGHNSSIWLRADQPGTYWGECAEYCGYQHAQMRLTVVAEPVDQFKNWMNLQRQDAPEPKEPMQVRGKQVFLQGACLMCHSVQGTEARGRVGPDLTHVAGRKLLAAGAVPNVPGHLAGWIANAQSVKPGVRMPPNNLSPQDLRALLEYLETLK